jgi:hypothetical protein
MTTTIIKMPKTVPAFATVAVEIGMNPADLIQDLDRVLGDRWCDEPSFSVSTLGVQDSGEVIPPAGYELVKGCTDVFVGPETASSAFIIRPSWHAATGLHSIEVVPSNGLGDMQQLAPDEALKLAADIKTAAESIRPVNIGAAVTAAV